MHDQADQLRKLVRQAVAIDGSLAPGGAVIALTGCRPGVGVTTAACQLARELARLGKQVVLVDANLQRPAVAKQLADRAAYASRSSTSGAASPTRTSSPPSPDQAWSGPAGSIADVLAGKRRAVEVLASAPDRVRVLPGPPPGELPTLDFESVDRFAGEITALRQQVDVVLIDAGCRMSPWADRIWQLARRVLLFAAPEDAAIVDAYTAVKLAEHHRLDGKVRLVFNRSDDDARAASLAQRFDATCRKFLFIGAGAYAALPPLAVGADAPADNSPYQRQARLLAADLACDVHASSLRISGAGRRTAAPPAPTRLAPADGAPPTTAVR